MIQPFNILEPALLFSFVLFADVASSGMEAVIVQALQSYGFSGAWLVVALYFARRLITWGTPHAEKVITAHIARQATMEECQVRLTESTIEIQKENQKALAEIKSTLPKLCLHPSKLP